jgi:hypothetical protein
MAHRPDVPPGHHLAKTVDPDWRICGRPRKCRANAGYRRKACGAPAVAELFRKYGAWWSNEGSWWAYCAQHMYGRWIEGERVMQSIVVCDEGDDVKWSMILDTSPPERGLG